jgi:hypothetical protein
VEDVVDDSLLVDDVSAPPPVSLEPSPLLPHATSAIAPIRTTATNRAFRFMGHLPISGAS